MPAFVLELQGDICFRKEEKHFLDALEYYQKSGNLNPDNFEIFLKQGKCYEKQRDFEKAIQLFQKAVDMNNESPWAHFRLGWVCIRNGLKNKGIEHLK